MKYNLVDIDGETYIRSHYFINDSSGNKGELLEFILQTGLEIIQAYHVSDYTIEFIVDDGGQIVKDEYTAGEFETCYQDKYDDWKNQKIGNN